MKTRINRMSMCLLAALGVAGVALAGESGKDRFASMDGNKDGKVSATEHAAGAKAMFQKMDTNSDGFVTAAEMDAMHAGMGHRMDHGMDHGKDRGMGHDMGEMDSKQKIADVDSDGDGKISATEHETASQSKFTAADANADGSLTQQEMDAAHKAMAMKKK